MWKTDPVSSQDAFNRLKACAFDEAPLPTAVFRKENSEGLVFLGGNSEFDALVLGNGSLDEGPERELAVALTRLVNAALSATSNPPTVAVHLGDRLEAFRPRFRPFKVPDDPEEYLVVQLTALTEQDSAESDLHSTIRHLKDLLDNSTALMYVKDLDGRYLIANEYYAKRLGRSAESIIGHTDYDLFAEPIAEAYTKNDDLVIRTAESIAVEEPLAAIGGRIDPDEDSRWLSIKFPLQDDNGNPYALGAISTDITDLKRAERAARDAMHEAERANRSKDEFLSRMSHELRTPLNAILGFAQLLQNLPLSPEAAESAGHILDAGKHLLALVNDVLDITWIEAGAPGITTAAVPAIDPIHQALQLIRPLASANDIEIASDLHGALHRYILADTQRLRQVFLNLLGNAVKFNTAQGAVRVWCEEKADFLRFFIMDTGPGMDESDAQRLFKPFVRLSQSAEVEGSGLGLALSKRLVQEMGGDLGIEHTAPGEGSTFFVDMPLAPAPEENPLTPAPSAGAVTNADEHDATILYIEDTHANIRLVESIIAVMGGLRLITATSGKSGIAQAQTTSPQLVLLDLNLSDMSGVEVVKRLQQDELTRQVPVIILSADATPARIAELRGIGILDYITKPFEIDHFARTIRNAVARP